MSYNTVSVECCTVQVGIDCNDIPLVSVAVAIVK